jgi:hypothetical protein
METTELTKEQSLVKEIHSAFDREADTLLVIPKKNFPKREAIEEKAERLKNLGFIRSSEVERLERFDRDLEAQVKQYEEQRTAHEFAQKYRTKYPGLKFITQEQLDEICWKYDLVTKDISEYTGEVPEQKLFEIEYRLDEIEEADIHVNDFLYSLDVFDEEKFSRLVEESRDRISCYVLASIKSTTTYHCRSRGKNQLSDPEIIEAFKNQGVPEKDIILSKVRIKESSNYGLRISAPESMFRKEPSKGLDPIVLQPVNGGYLVIAKWGEEANDPELVVPELN